MKDGKKTVERDWKYIRQGFIALALISLFFSIGLMYVFYNLGFAEGVLSVYETGMKSPNECPVAEEGEIEGEEEVVEEPTEYANEVLVVGASYDPSEDEYYGFKTCDYEMSSCTVYGVMVEYVEDFEMDQEYMLYYNELGDGGAAAGTAYIPVVGEAMVVAR